MLEQLVMRDTPQHAFSALLEQRQAIIYKIARTYCWDAEDRRDLIQEIHAQLWRAYPKYDASRRFSTWLYRIALNVAISHVRSASYHKQHLTSLDEQSLSNIPAPDIEEPDARLRTLQNILRQLDALNRALLLLYLEERSYQEIAEVLGISETNVATKISRLKQKLRASANTD